ncbi:MAG: hypothetical protein KAT15_20200, partial [Bacteroidales bacterium]|nr:hypothetical protein [Bacteroidales bacterium]
SWYLDAAADHWSALIMDDYRYIMPVVWKRKFGIRYLYQPVFCQQLGVFSKEFTDPAIIRQFNNTLLGRFRFGVVNFNMKNLVGEEQPFEVADRSNYVLPLQNVYEDLYRSYSVNARRNLKRSMEHPGNIEKDISFDELITFKRENDITKKTEGEYVWMKSLFGSVIHHSSGSVYGIRDDDKLIAAAFIGFSRTRAIYLLSVSSGPGKEYRAMFRIVDEVIRSFANSDLALDFEGSNIPSIARFFGGFGAKPEIYQSVSFSRLPVPFILRKIYGRKTP